MAIEDLWKAAGRAQLDPAFAQAVRTAPGEVMRSEGLVLDGRELEHLVAIVHGAAPGFEEMHFQQDMAHQQATAQFERARDLGRYTVQILKDTLDTARQTYRVIKWMTIAMFATGLALFIAAAVVSLVTEESRYAVVFGGLGTVTFVALFFTGPIDKSQNALSNLVQAEILFMNFFEQITFWENFALAPEGNPPRPNKDNIEKASTALQERTLQTSQLLQEYVEKPG